MRVNRERTEWVVVVRDEKADWEVDEGEKPLGVSLVSSGLMVRGFWLRERGEGGEGGEKVKEEGEVRRCVGEVWCEEKERVMVCETGPSEAELPVLTCFRIGSACGMHDGDWPMTDGDSSS